MDMLEIMKKEEAYCSDHRDMPGELQKKAKMLCWRYNQTSPEEGDVRAEILRELLGTCHPLTFIESSFRCDYGFNIHTHGLTVINYNCVILDTSPVISWGKRLLRRASACLLRPFKDAAQRAAGIGTSAPVTIGRDVWIGANSTVCGGVFIGDGTIIGAGSVVTKDIPSGVIAAGNPCRVLRKVTEEDRCRITGEERGNSHN